MLRLCAISVGLVLTCGYPYTGTVPLLRPEGLVRSCDARAGYVVSCGHPYSGDAPLPQGRGGKIVSCKVAAGSVTWCAPTGYTGSTALIRP